MLPYSSGQVRLPIEFLKEPDRNFSHGGRSFYFFDFDDNVVHLPTEIFLFSKTDNSQRAISTHEFAKIAHQIGNPASAEWGQFKLIEDPKVGSFKRFREQETLKLNEQPLIQDMNTALTHKFVDWRGPSWDFFVYAVNNNRPISVITARGHHPHTIRRAIDLLVLSRDLGAHPNYLSVYPVSHPETRHRLENEILFHSHKIGNSLSTAELKKRAIHRAVRDAMECYGENPFHRFGMSDDDPSNVALIREAMKELKQIYPDNAFFVISTFDRKVFKEEIRLDSDDNPNKSLVQEQISLF